jgi:hypothetical protein
MLRMKLVLLSFAIGALWSLGQPGSAEAGPLLDWIRSHCRRSSCPQTVGYAPVAANAYGLQPGQCLKTCPQTCSRTVVNYVPHTAYRTEWKRVPVTQYRPVTTSDPCTGCTVTCMRPCTTYTYQCQRVPYTTYRPEYRTETYQVPVTTITNECATGNCSPATECPTCVAPGAVMPGNFAPVPGAPTDGTYYEYPATTAPRGAVISPNGTFNTNVVPADTQPTLAPSSTQRPVIESMRLEPSRTIYSQPTPANYSQPPIGSGVEYGGYTAQRPAHREWNYVPSRLASHVIEPSGTNALGMQPIARIQNEREIQTGQFNEPVSRTTSQRDDMNGWKLVK